MNSVVHAPWTIPHWSAAGFNHGFLDNRLDARESIDLTQLGFAAGSALHLLNQVHGADFVELIAAGSGVGSVSSSMRAAADGWIIRVSAAASEDSRADGVTDVFGVRSADCTPVILWSPESRLAAALHCGWRSTVGGLLPRVIQRLKVLGAKRIELAVGPGARWCCFEVGEEVVDQVSPNYRQRCVRQRNGKKMFGVDELLVAQAESEGVNNVDIYRFFLCSICSARFFSHRRQKASAGRQLSYICR